MEGWLARYVNEYTAKFESPRLFHLWSAIAVLGHVMGRRVWMARGGVDGYYVYPAQIMVCLVSRSAVVRKGLAINKATSFFAKCPPWSVNILPERTSPQQVFDSLARLGDDKEPLAGPDGYRLDSVGFIDAEELGMWLSKESWMEGMVAILTKLNNAPEGEKTVKFRTWSATLMNPCIGGLFGTTPKGVAEEIPATATKTGLFGRVIWVCVNEPEREANDLLDPVVEDRALRRWLEDDLDRIVGLSGPVVVSKQAKGFLREWYKEHYQRLTRLNVDLQSESGFLGRKFDHVLRAGIVLGASAGHLYRERVLLNEGTAHEAVQLLDEVEAKMPRAFQELGVDKRQDYETRVLHALERAKARDGWMRKDHLVSRLTRYGGIDRFKQAIALLVAGGNVEQMEDVRGKEWFKRVWKAGELVKRSRSEV